MKRCAPSDLGGRLRLLVGKPGLDGHSNGAEQVALAARNAGFEVVYAGIRQTPAQLVAAAVAEDVHCVGVSVLSGAHLELVPAVVDGLRAQGLDDVPVVVGGIIPPADAEALAAAGVAAVFTPADHDLGKGPGAGGGGRPCCQRARSSAAGRPAAAGRAGVPVTAGARPRQRLRHVEGQRPRGEDRPVGGVRGRARRPTRRARAAAATGRPEPAAALQHEAGAEAAGFERRQGEGGVREHGGVRGGDHGNVRGPDEERPVDGRREAVPRSLSRGARGSGRGSPGRQRARHGRRGIPGPRASRGQAASRSGRDKRGAPPRRAVRPSHAAYAPRDATASTSASAAAARAAVATSWRRGWRGTRRGTCRDSSGQRWSCRLHRRRKRKGEARRPASGVQGSLAAPRTGVSRRRPSTPRRDRRRCGRGVLPEVAKTIRVKRSRPGP